MKKFEKWTIAYRKKSPDKTLLDDTISPFTCIKNTWRYWCADPHIIEVQGQNYIFAELYDRIFRKGVIGYCSLNDTGVSSWKMALRLPFHLSYPHLIEKNGIIYMIPESYVANEIAVYQAVHFPDQWKKIDIIKKDYCAADSTFIMYQQQPYLLTLKFDNHSEQLHLLSTSSENIFDSDLCLTQNDSQKRPGGHFFYCGNDLIRPAQDCSFSYGCALNFYKITYISKNAFNEVLIKKISPEMLQTNLCKTPKGIHTYNYNQSYEVIDLKEYEIDLLSYIMRPVWFIYRRIKKLFHK